MILRTILRTSILLLLTGVVQLSMAQSQRKAQEKKYTRVNAGYLMVLRQGDDLFAELTKFVTDEGIPSANFTGMGFVDVTFGFFNFDTKEYLPKDFKGVELASMHGGLAWKEKTPSIHAHGVVGDEEFRAHAGHILRATVSTGSLEIMIVTHTRKLQRSKDESIGADVLQLDH